MQLASGEYSGKVIRHFDTGNLLAAVTNYDITGRRSDFHSHENTHISFVLHGGSNERKKNENYERLPGTSCFYHQGEVHQTDAVLPTTHLNLEVGERFFSAYGIREEDIAKAIARPLSVPFVLLKIYKEILEADEHTASAADMLLLCTLRDVQQKQTLKIPKWVPQVQNLLHDCWNGRPTLQDLSLETGIHPVSISKYFPVYFSCSFGEYMRKLKIQRSIGLLEKYSCTEVAYLCGFADQSHFIRNFRLYTGFSPAGFSRQVKLHHNIPS